MVVLFEDCRKQGQDRSAWGACKPMPYKMAQELTRNRKPEVSEPLLQTFLYLVFFWGGNSLFFSGICKRGRQLGVFLDLF